MISRLRLRFFAHSWLSDWNHGNAHFLRGLVDELQNLGHDVRCYEEEGCWSYVNLLQEDLADVSLERFTRAFPKLELRRYSLPAFEAFAAAELHDADVVVVHEWSSPRVTETILRLKKQFGFRALFHDTHHRAYTAPNEIAKLGIAEFDGILAFGEPIRQIYEELFHVRAWTFHEAADTARFYPLPDEDLGEINWVGNWGDDERTRELEEFLIHPLAKLGRKAAVYGVRYPQRAKALLRQSGIEYRGYLPNLCAPEIFSRCALTLHIPRRCYANGLSGIPTIRMFEAFACGVPLLCSPWNDRECLFRPNQDYISVSDGNAMQAEIAHLSSDSTARRQLASQALQTIRGRHTCRHRALQFEDICEELGK